MIADVVSHKEGPYRWRSRRKLRSLFFFVRYEITYEGQVIRTYEGAVDSETMDEITSLMNIAWADGYNSCLARVPREGSTS